MIRILMKPSIVGHWPGWHGSIAGREVRRFCGLRFVNSQSHSRPIRVLDLATGSGDVPIDLWQRAKRAGMEIDISACDISPLAIETAKAAAKKRNANVRFFIADVLSDPISERFDIVTCSLFFHHLDEPELISILQKMRDLADSIVLANDLSRGRLNFVLVWLASHLFSRSRIVHVDGALSIRGAFTPVELSALAERAGLNGATVKPRFPCRMLLSWRKP